MAKRGKLFKSLFCKHNYRPWAWISPELRGEFRGCQTVLLCPKCGKRKYIKELLPTPVNYDWVLRYIAFTKTHTEQESKQFYKQIYSNIIRDEELLIMNFGDLYEI